jgi:hypothetical protein
MCSWHRPVRKFKKGVDFFKRRFSRNRMDDDPRKSKFLLSMDFLGERDNKPRCKFYMKKVELRIYRMIPRMLDLGG